MFVSIIIPQLLQDSCIDWAEILIEGKMQLTDTYPEVIQIDKEKVLEIHRFTGTRRTCPNVAPAAISYITQNIQKIPRR